MESNEFKSFRKKLNKTQKQLSQLLGTSLKAIHSYEQGWRTIPPAVELQLFFLISRISNRPKPNQQCWRIKKCPTEQKKKCPAWEFKSGNLCWFINGTICEGDVHKNWKEKMKVCRSCEVFTSIFWSPSLFSSWLPTKNQLISTGRWIREGCTSTYRPRAGIFYKWYYKKFKRCIL